MKNIYLACRELGVDPTVDMIPVSPAAHYTIGGVRTGLKGETNIRGLFACGEVASTGVHGANRLASNSLLECVVFAKRAIDGALQSMGSVAQIPRGLLSKVNNYDFKSSGEPERDIYMQCRKTISAIMNRKVGMIRSKSGLTQALIELDECSVYPDKLSGYFRIKLNMLLQVSELIARFSKIREESRGVHIREDFPEEDPKWKSHIVMEKGREPQILEG